ncbi:tRNA 2-selenouridine(34) synthase MnmH [Haloimpatiens sp. FM7315]|uniref:tRNA 2-selenouridine(34) synthase MnmH n=1 Tax=Haloimpatiens sp. FM7315 TaxID=3298609 RepID=UPI00370B4E7D
MFKDIDYEELENGFNKEEVLFVDVRSPKEFEEYTIPGAINMPILNDEEREEIGTIYVHESVEKAKRMGLEVASKKLLYIYDKIKELEKSYKHIVLFCARGGLRSSVITMMLFSLGAKVYKLKGGYKGYRAFVNKKLPLVNEEANYVVLQGNTGVGKTKILKELKKRGYNILDLEGCANHRGSLLGSVGIGKGNRQKKFESLIYEELKNSKGNLFFVEGESKRIGNAIIPDCIYNKMRVSKRILVKADIDYRAKVIMEEYTKRENYKEEISSALNSLEKYIKRENIDRYLKMVSEDNCIEVAKELMLKYYDPMYENGEKKYEYVLELIDSDVNRICDKIEENINRITI